MIGRLFDKLSFYVLLLLLAFLGLSLLRNYQNVKRVEEQISNKETGVQKVRQEGEELSQRLESVKSDEFVESQLRDKLGLAKEGEIVVILPSEDVLRKIAPKYEQPREELPDPNWRKWIRIFF